MNSLFKKARHYIISLRFSITSIFVIFFITTTLFLISLGYFRSSNTILFTANKLMTNVASKIISDIDNVLLDAEDETQFVAKQISINSIDVNNDKTFIPYLFDLVKRYPVAQAAFWSDENGNFTIAEKEPDGDLMLRVINRSSTPPTYKIKIYDKNSYALIKEENSTDFSFDPRTRPWYVSAKKEKKPIWTDVYVYQPSNLLGITVASPIFYPNGVFRGTFAFAIRLDYLSKFISEEAFSKNGMVFMATQNGEVIAFPSWDKTKLSASLTNIHALNMPWLADSFDHYQKTKNPQFIFKFDKNSYLTSYAPIPHFSAHKWIVGIIAPVDDFILDLKKGLIWDVMLGGIVLLIGILLISFIISRVISPIKNVVLQIDKIKHFDLRKPKKIVSHIKEVILLSDAVKALRSGLQSFQKYVPSLLVRQLIETGQDARIGGTKQSLTIFFSDIENFTTLAENMEPNKLMEHVCFYFDEMSKIILNEKGTIDKYIGDSIMAFWGAPLRVDVPCERAANAALQCIKRLEILNNEWLKNDKQPLKTRIGLHMGEAIVGNVGSSERLNYTALGDAINMTSRLEQINKIYSTKIIVSESVYQAIKDKFVLRFVDCIAVKGKILSINIYELLAHSHAELSFDIDLYQKIYSKGFAAYQNSDWDAAITAFESCLEVYPEDKVVQLFIHRCQEFKAKPPHHWDGVWRFIY